MQELPFTSWYEEDYDLPSSKYYSRCTVAVSEYVPTSPLLFSEPNSSGSCGEDNGCSLSDACPVS